MLVPLSWKSPRVILKIFNKREEAERRAEADKKRKQIERNKRNAELKRKQAMEKERKESLDLAQQEWL